MRTRNRGQVLLIFLASLARHAGGLRPRRRRGVHVHRAPRTPALHRCGGARRSLRFHQRELVGSGRPNPRGQPGAHVRREGQGGDLDPRARKRGVGGLPGGGAGPRPGLPHRPPLLLPALPRPHEDPHRLLGRRGVRCGLEREGAEALGDTVSVGGHERERRVRCRGDGLQGLPPGGCPPRRPSPLGPMGPRRPAGVRARNRCWPGRRSGWPAH